MSLLSYKEARPWARAIRSKIASGEMPPWGADPRYGRFRNAPKMTAAEINVLLAWVDGGAQEGTGAPPSPPSVADGASVIMGREPDVTIQMPIEMRIPANGVFPDSFDVYSKIPIDADKFIEAIELRPSNRAVTHHSSVRAQPLPEGTKIGTAPSWPGGPLIVNAMAVPRDSGTATVTGMDASGVGEDQSDNVLMLYLPGGSFQRLRPGVAKRIRAGDYFVWRLHYTATGKPETDRHTLRLWFQTVPVTHVIEPRYQPFPPGGGARCGGSCFVEGRELLGRERQPNIPPFADNYGMMGVKAFPVAVTISSISPHMHYRGKDMTFTVTYPDGREEIILRVPKYKFAWQFAYEFEEPLKLPAGTVMRIVAHWDNSAANRYNPSPDKEVIWAGQSWDEMFSAFMDLWLDDVVIDSSKPASSRPRDRRRSAGQ